MKWIYLFAMISFTFGLAACGPSEAVLATAVAGTQVSLAAAATATEAARPTATPPPTNTPAPTDTPMPSPTPVLYTSNGKKFVPTEADMPFGFMLQTSNSGPMDGGDGYMATFLNPNNMTNFGEPVLVVFQVFVPDTEAHGEEMFIRLADHGAEFLAAFRFEGEQVKSKIGNVDVRVPDVDESLGIYGTMQGPLFEKSVCGISVRVKNLLSSVYVMSNELEPSQRGCLQQAQLFQSLVIDRLEIAD